VKKLLKHREAVPAILVIVAYIAGFIMSPHFTPGYLLDASSLYAETGLLALGMTLVIICGQIDLSVAATMALVACVSAKMLAAGIPPLVALPASILLGGALGWFNGFLVGRIKLPSFVVTLATMAGYRGVAQVIMGPDSVSFPPGLVGIDYKKFLGLPYPLLILIFFAILVGLLLHRRILGRWMVVVGTNERAAFYSGVPSARVTATAFAITGALAGVAGLLINSRLGVARFDHANGLEVEVITAVVLGGASIYGGEGSILGTMLALVLIGEIRSGMGLANVTAEYQMAVVGTLLVLTVAFGNVFRKLTSARRPATMSLQPATEAQET